MLLSQMTLLEKLDLMGLANESGYQNVTTAVPRLCIPQLTMSDAPSGNIAGAGSSHTQLPAEVAMAATWDRSAAQQYGTVLGSEAATKQIDVVQGPELDIDRVPLWGRTFETLGEDPYLTGALGVADIQGIHTEGTGVNLKHYTVYNQEQFRNTVNDNSIVTNRVLHEMYLPAFQQAVVQGKAESVMCSYATINGDFACENSNLLTQVLNDQWGFAGYVRSDLGAVHDPVKAVNAGTDVIKAAVPDQIMQAVLGGQISEARLDDAVSRVLREMFQLGAFNRPSPNNAAAAASTPEHVALARSVSEESTVLLKNTAGTLPLQGNSAQSIAVIGADGGSGALTAGGGSGNVSPGSIVTPLQGITQRAGSAATVSFSDGSNLSDAAATAHAANVAVVFVDVPTGEGSDLKSLSLPGDQDQLIETVAAANPNTVVVLNTADPVTMPWLDQVHGVVEAWYPGQEDGNAIAAVLFGDVNPSGKLPMTFPQSLAKTPTATPAQYPGVGGTVQYSEGLQVGYRWYDANDETPLFPFGYGLSYTSFAFSNLHVTSPVTNPVSTPAPSACGCNGQSTGLVNVTATVTNTGTRTGSEVAQLYLGDPAQAGEPPRQLKGFQKVTLAPGGSTVVHFTLTGHDLSYWDDTAEGWVLPDGGYQVYVGDSSATADLPLRGQFTITKSLGALYAQVQAPSGQLTSGAATPISVRYTNGGDYTLVGVHPTLQTPPGWTATLTTPPAPATLTPGQSVVASWSVTVPEQAQATTQTLTARLDFHPDGASRGLASTAATADVTVAPVPVQASAAPTPALAQVGQATPVTLTFNSSVDHPITVTYRVGLPSGGGITVSPDHGTVTVPPGGTSVTLTALPSAVGAYPLTVSLSATDHGQTFQLQPTGFQVLVPVSSLAAAFNNVGITDDSDHTPGNFDGVGNSYSAQALAGLGITPGATITERGINLTWPNVPAGTADNVAARGQAVSLSGSGGALAFLGAAANGTQTATVTVFYTDGTSQQATIGFNDWINATPFDGDDLVVTTPYFNRTTPGPARTPSVFAAYAPLDPGKQVAAIALPTNANLHLFAAAIG